ncbi:MAG TPA: RnfABCDGE type electron transport complex subunit D [Clostridiaceae bacterium]|nr:RnfABCDGE type electron transport complex subunit D [Clostridiaceae bacterium]
MEKTLLVSSSPHLRDGASTRRIMIDVVISLIPASAAGIYFFGPRVLLVILTTVLSCVLFEYLSRKAMKRESTIQDFSAVVTGVLLALNLPPAIPLWVAAVGGFIAIVIIKQLFGGLGQNFMNPAMGARVFLLIAYPKFMSSWIVPGPDAVSSATPLGMIKATESAAGQLPDYFDLFIGKVGGCVGETSVLALLIGAAYLVYRRVITLEIPLTFVATVALFTWIFGGDTLFTGDFIYHILSGGLMIGAFFMATDYTTSPVTRRGKIIAGIMCGLVTSIIRLYANYPEGVSFAILLMNIATPLIDRFTLPRSFGGEKPVAQHN